MWVGLGFVGWAELGLRLIVWVWLRLVGRVEQVLRMGLWVGLGIGLFLAG